MESFRQKDLQRKGLKVMILVSTKQSKRTSWRPSLASWRRKTFLWKTDVVVRADRDLFLWLLVIWEKRDVSMKDFLRYSFGPVAWSLATPPENVFKSAKSDLLTCLENKINLVNQIPPDAARMYDGMCIIRQ